jgi:two-component system nitrate/nitrite response regulator NarL
VLVKMMAGLSTEAIAQSLGTSVSTVRSQIGGVLRKLGVHSQREAISLAFRSGWSLEDKR